MGGKRYPEVYGVDFGELSINKKTGEEWSSYIASGSRYIPEDKFADYLQAKDKGYRRLNLDRLLNPEDKVNWYGREFDLQTGWRADFAGIDEDGYFLAIELKMVTGRIDLAKKLGNARKLVFNGIKGGYSRERLQYLVNRYVKAKLIRRNKDRIPPDNSYCFMGKLKDIHKRLNRKGKVSSKDMINESMNNQIIPDIIRGFKFAIIAPYLAPEVLPDIKDFRDQEGRDRVKFKYVLFKLEPDNRKIHYCRVKIGKGF